MSARAEAWLSIAAVVAGAVFAEVLIRRQAAARMRVLARHLEISELEAQLRLS